MAETSAQSCEEQVVSWCRSLEDSLERAQEKLLIRAEQLHEDRERVVASDRMSGVSDDGDGGGERASEIRFLPHFLLRTLLREGLGVLVPSTTTSALPLLPSHFHIYPQQPLLVVPGCRVTCFLSHDDTATAGEVTSGKSIFDSLSIFATQAQRPLNVELVMQEHGRGLKIDIEVVQDAGVVKVIARLWNQHVRGSPLLVPVFPVLPEPMLARLGLQVPCTNEELQLPCCPGDNNVKTKRRPVMQVTSRTVPVLRQPRGPGEGDRGFEVTRRRRRGEGAVNKEQKINTDNPVLNDKTTSELRIIRTGSSVRQGSHEHQVKQETQERSVKEKQEKQETKEEEVKQMTEEQKVKQVVKEEKVKQVVHNNIGDQTRVWQVGEVGVARWAEDGVWYRARVRSRDNGGYTVVFIDYNTGSVRTDHLVTGVAEVPEEDKHLVDGFVYENPAEKREKNPKRSVGGGSSPGVTREGEFGGGHLSIVTSEEGTSKKGNRSTKVEEEEGEECVVVYVRKGVSGGHVWSVGEEGVARWSLDGVWYRAKVTKVMARPRDKCEVVFTDYGTKSVVKRAELVRRVEEVPRGDIIDSHVTKGRGGGGGGGGDQRTVSSRERCQPSLCSLCDQVRRNCRRLLCDGSSVCWNCAVVSFVGSHTCWRCGTFPANTRNHLLLTDQEHKTVVGQDQKKVVKKKLNKKEVNEKMLEDVERPFDLVSLCGSDTKQPLRASHLLSLTSLRGPRGLLVLSGSGDLLVSCAASEDKAEEAGGQERCHTSGEVVRYNSSTQCLSSFSSHYIFSQPTHLLQLSLTGEVVIADSGGLHVFAEADGAFVRDLGGHAVSTCHGLAEDSHGRLVVINSNHSKQRRHHTEPGHTDVLYIDVLQDKLVLKVDLDDLISKEERNVSKCRFVACRNNKLYVGDRGLHKIYVIYTDDRGLDSANKFGQRGNGVGQFKGPTDIAVDDNGNCLVVDSRNYRVQLIDKNYNYVCTLKVDKQLTRPTAMFLDTPKRQLWLVNEATHSVVLYRLEDDSS